jgi:hypothetical protein
MWHCCTPRCTMKTTASIFAHIRVHKARRRVLVRDIDVLSFCTCCTCTYSHLNCAGVLVNYRHTPTEHKVTCRKFRRQSKFAQGVIEYAHGQLYVYTRESSWNENWSTLEPDRPQHDCLAVCVIAQQYSSATYVSFPRVTMWRPFQKCYSVSIFAF